MCSHSLQNFSHINFTRLTQPIIAFSNIRFNAQKQTHTQTQTQTQTQSKLAAHSHIRMKSVYDMDPKSV